MGTIDLQLGPIELDGHVLQRSGMRWLRDDGAPVRRGDVVAYCSIGLRRTGPRGPDPFAAERRDLQIAIAAPVQGRLRLRGGLERGGYRNTNAGSPWDADTVVASIESNQQQGGAPMHADLLLMAGQRTTELAEVRSGLLTGWHSVSRAAHIPVGGRAGTLLSLGICELEPVMKGRHHAFLEILQAAAGPAQVVFVPDQPLVPSARFLAEQLHRSAAETERVAGSIAAFAAGSDARPDAEGLIFAGAVLKALPASPIVAHYDMITRTGLAPAGPADAVLLSVRAENAMLLRHKELGYSLSLHRYRLAEAGAAFNRWLRDNFVQVSRSVEGIADDYEKLLAAIRRHSPNALVLVSNAMSTSGADELQCYAPFDAPLARNIESVLAKDLNLMLADLARRHDIAIVETDALGAQLGLRRHSPDGLHHDGVMAAAVRDEVLQILHARRVPGFGARAGPG